MFRLFHAHAFVPLDDDDEHDKHDESGDININGSRPMHQQQINTQQQNNQQPPLLSVEPKLSNNNKLSKELISPLNNNNIDDFSRVEVCSPPGVVSECSIISTTSDSSYSSTSSATQQISPLSSIGGSYYFGSSGNSSINGGGINKYCVAGQQQKPQQNNKADLTKPNSIHKRSKSEGGIFDCVVKPLQLQRSASMAVSTAKQSTSQQQQLIIQKPHIRRSSSAASLTSLFESCIRPADEETNEYTTDYNNNEGASHRRSNSYMSSASGYSYNRSISVGSATSSQTNHSHNSYYNNQSTSNNNNLPSTTSLSSIKSAFTTNTQLSYTTFEKNMIDGDEPTIDSDLNRVRNYHVVTTAALPWMTGTAVNPLLRAGYLLRHNDKLKRQRMEEKEQQQVESEVEEKVGNTSPAESEESESTLQSLDLKARLSNGESSFYFKNSSSPPDDELSNINTYPGRESPSILASLQTACQEIREESSFSVDVLDVEEVAEEEGESPQLEMDTLNINDEEEGVSPSTLSSPSNHLGEVSPGECSLDYSCFSFSEISPAGANIKNKLKVMTATDNDNDDGQRRADVVSPLGDDDSFLLSPITPCEATAQLLLSSAAADKKVPKEMEGCVTLVVPWLTDPADRLMLYGSATVGNLDSGEQLQLPMFANQEEQEAYIRSWLEGEAGMPEEAKELKILFYPARYHKSYVSIFASGDIIDLIPDESADVCILEEPEHLNWYRAPGSSSWSSKFGHCVGVIHTNYKAYARDHAKAGFVAAPLLAGVNSLVVQANCHRVVKLSGVLQEFGSVPECVENVHGIRQTFLKEGKRRRASLTSSSQISTEQRRAYFIGKLLWAKGFDHLLDLQTCFRERTGDHFEVDIFGSGPDEDEIKRAFAGSEEEESSSSGGILQNWNKWSGSSAGSHRQSIPANFLGRVDHSSLAGDAYSIFINPSLTEVLCTTTAEAIAMHKWAIIPSHPSNDFFIQFPNCLPYRNRREFVTTLRYAMNNDPPELSDELSNLLSWEAATMRCVEAAAISRRDAARSERILNAKLSPSGMKKTLSGLWNELKSGENSPTSSPTETSSSPRTGYGSILPLISP